MDLEGAYRKYKDMVFRICSRYCRDREEAEDLTQESFLRFDKALQSFRGDSDLGTWIYRVATNACLDHLRKRKSRDRLYADYLDSLIVRNLNSGGDRVLARIDLDRILETFRPEVRQMLFLTLAEGLSYREAGEVMNVTKESVAKTVARFLQKFQKNERRKLILSQKTTTDCP